MNLLRLTIRKNMTNILAQKVTGSWWLRLANGITHEIHLGTPDGKPFDIIPEFDYGDAWSIDAGSRSDLHYPLDPTDDSFVLIPKKDVVEVFFKPYKK